MKLALLCTGLLVVCGCGRPSTGPPPATPTTKSGAVTIEVRIGDDSERYLVDDIAAGTTLESVMRGASEIPVEITGSGTTAFLHRIGERETGAGEGWTFTVDGEFANSGIGSTKLSPPTTVVWTFGADPSWDSDSLD